MSKFETYIQDWRNAITENEALTLEDISELEDHLQTDFSQLKKMGLNDQDAFWLAEKRLGNISNICSEYQKVNGGFLWARRAQWMLVGYLVFSLLQLMISSVSQLAAAGAAFSGSGWISFIVYGFVQFVMLIGFLYAIYHLVFGTGNYPKVLGNILQFARISPGKTLVIIIASIGALSLSAGVLTANFMSSLLDPYQFSSYAYGKSVLSFVLGIVYPLLILSLLIQSRRKQKQPKQTTA